jgi:HTH-type transcriptional regulator / antitoxin HipB
MSTSDKAGAGSQPFRVYSTASLGTAIRHFRKGQGLSQGELGERAGMSRYYLTALENGKETEHLQRILAVLRELGVRITLDKAEW